MAQPAAAAGAVLKSLAVEPPIKPGTPDPYTPPKAGESRPETHLQIGAITQYVTTLVQTHDELPDAHHGIEGHNARVAEETRWDRLMASEQASGVTAGAVSVLLTCCAIREQRPHGSSAEAWRAGANVCPMCSPACSDGGGEWIQQS